MSCETVLPEGGGPYRRNIICEHLRNLGIFKDKRIPDIYLNASEEEGYELLAGLIDTDGALPDHIADGKNYPYYTFFQGGNHQLLFDDVKKLAQSLDLNVSTTI